MLFSATTIVAVKQDNKVAIAGDGQVTFGGNMIMKQQANKVRKLYNDQVLAGFAGSVADAFNLYDKFEQKLEEYRGQLQRAAVELAKEWRQDKVLRRLEALLIVADQNNLLIISGEGEVIEPDAGIAAIGSGGGFALAAAKALSTYSDLDAKQIAIESLKIAASMCVYTNGNITVEVL